MKKQRDVVNVVWSVDNKGNEFESDFPKFCFYDVYEKGSRFVVRFYGACDIHSEPTLDQAKEYVRNKIQKGKY